MKKIIYFQRGKNENIKFSSISEKINEIGIFVFFIFVGFFCFFLIIRLFALTIVKGNYYQQLAQNNRIKEFLIEPERGKIIDRKGFTIVENKKADIEIDEKKIKNKRFLSKRIYYYPEETAHIVGYQQNADEKDIKNDNCLNKLILGDKTGKKGVEKLFECQLRGIAGKKLIETNALGNFLKTIAVYPPKPGKTIQLALDLELQKKTYELIKEKKGAVVASIPKTGEVLVLASSPSFNPQDFEDKNKNVEKYLKDKNQPLFNRALDGVYPPGSIFKMIVAVAGLEEKKIDEKTVFEDKGIIKSGPNTFGNWYYLQYGKTEGIIDVVKAIKRSNDIFFYLAGEKIGAEKIKKWAEIFGLGKKTEIGLDETEGVIPSSFWKETTLKEKWYTGDTYNLSIGQGYLLTTPIQMNFALSVFANNGYYCQPSLLKNQKPKCKKLPISQKNIELIKKGMKEACSDGGTGWPFFDFKIKISDSESKKIEVGCKTGTAESHAKSGKPHAWINVFAPYENPEIIITVLIEEGGQGSDIAGPIAKEILKQYFERKE
ncbi:MAG: penicillin-binding transpeptidase domain-containing protein [Patescibacteria group bacterium]|nr:penicillin-binding transpeptidase domain-containing protein [Patescibacteria group bacterium]